MSVQKLTQVTVQGLATNPNPNALPAGSCAVLTNATIRHPGTIAPMSTFATVVDTTVTSGRKLLFNDVNNKNVIVYSDFNGTANGKLQSFTFNSTSYVLDSIVTQLPSNMTGSLRDLVFLPGKAQGVSSHFRHLITERSGVVVNQERWAGLPPPQGFHISVTTDSVFADTDGFLEDGNSVAYRQNFTLESTDDTKPYIVNGPVSCVQAVTNDTGSLARTALPWFAPTTEPIKVPTGTQLYLNIYRSSQAAVTTVAELPDDFRLIRKIAVVTPFTDTFFDRTSDDGRAAGEPLYTNNIGQFGGQSSKYAPPSSNDVCVFKDTTFYANRANLPELVLSIPGAFGQLQSNKDRTYGIGDRPYVTATTTLGSANITFVSADELLGVVPGQAIHSTAFSGNVTVVSVNTGTKTVVASSVATSGGSVATGYFSDQITVTGNYAYLSPVTATTDIVVADQDLGVPGMRLLHPATDRTHVVYGTTLTVQYVWNAISTMTNFYVYVTNGQNYSPAYTGNFVTKTVPLISLGETRQNRLFFSVTGEPEAVPLANYVDVGAGSIIKMWANQSALLICCTDGLWKLTEGDPFPVYQVDPTAKLVHPDCLTSLNNVAYGWVTDGIAQITEDGATTISTDAIGPALKTLYKSLAAFGGTPLYRWGFSLTGDSLKNELWFNTTDTEREVTTLEGHFLYNDDTKNFSSHDGGNGNQPIVFGMYSPVVGQTVFLSEATSGFHTLVQVPSDSYSAGGVVATTYFPLTVWFNPLQTEEKGNLKQFVDLNYFTANFTENPASGTDYMKALFNAKGEASDSTLDTVNIRNMALISRDVHYFVPRRTALSDQQQIGIQTFTLDEEELDTAFYIEIQGFTMRYRVASSTLKR